MGKRLAWKALAVTLAVSLIMSFCAVSAFADDGTQDEAEEGIARTQVDPSEEETASAEGESVEETVPESGDTESEITTETPEPEAVSQPEENLSEPEASQNAEATETDLQPADSDPQDGASIFDSINSTDSDEIVIEIDGDHALSAPLVIPENKHVIITSKTGASDAKPFVISVSPDTDLGTLVTISKGASLSLKGSLTWSGERLNGNGSMFKNLGELILEAGNKITGYKASGDSTSVIAVEDGASLTIRGATIEQNEIRGGQGATILVEGGSKVTIESGSISGNTANSNLGTASSGILVNEGSLHMTGGTIQDNKSMKGSAVWLAGNGNGARFTMDGGTITGNSYLGSRTSASGAIHVEGNSSFTLNDGLISANQGGSGGAISVIDSDLINNDGRKASFQMNGGVISMNSAISGGAIFVNSDGVKLNAGEIIDNKAENLGGAIYAEGNKDAWPTLHLENALIAKNSAIGNTGSSGVGGGVWVCPTGGVDVRFDKGVAIFDNSAESAGDDFVSARGNKAPEGNSLSNRILGNGWASWYEDGGVTEGNPFPMPTDDLRFDPAYPGKEVKVNGDHQERALKSIVDEDGKNAAKAAATLIISGNSAPRGGGIASNGGLRSGDTTATKTIKVFKEWLGDIGESGSKLPEKLLVHLVIDGKRVQSQVLNRDNAW
ncbi:MAG: hypothetical protein SPG36_05355, partial [Eggerthellaceae bacterium]|nr:hypothetical protein [Eggerthellaceae bacterium]